MRTLLFLLLASPILALAQNQSAQYSQHMQADFYVDSVKVDIRKTFFHAESIDSMHVEKMRNNGVYIYLNKTVNLQKLNEINYKQIDTLQNRIFFIDKNLINKPSEVRIDISEIAEMEIVNSSSIEEYSGNFNIIFITTVSRKNKIENEKEIRIKG